MARHSHYVAFARHGEDLRRNGLREEGLLEAQQAEKVGRFLRGRQVVFTIQ